MTQWRSSIQAHSLHINFMKITNKSSIYFHFCVVFVIFVMVGALAQVDRAADIQRENLKKKRRELEQASMDAASDLLDTDSNATFAMVVHHFGIQMFLFLFFFLAK